MPALSPLATHTHTHKHTHNFQSVLANVSLIATSSLLADAFAMRAPNGIKCAKNGSPQKVKWKKLVKLCRSARKLTLVVTEFPHTYIHTHNDIGRESIRIFSIVICSVLGQSCRNPKGYRGLFDVDLLIHILNCFLIC